MKRKTTKIKKTLAALAIVVMVAAGIGMSGCGSGSSVSEIIKIGALNGPTGMGLVKLMDQTDKYDVKTFASPDEVTGKVIKGDLDIAAVPSNLASVIYNKTKGEVVAVSPITLGVLYVVENGTKNITTAKSLKGKSIYASGKGGVPEYVLQHVLESNGLEMSDVNIKWLANQADVQQQVLKKEGNIALLPEPFVTIATSKNKKLSVALDMNLLWKKATGQNLPMGVVIARKDFLEKRGSDMDVFISDADESVKFVNENPAEAAKLISKWGFIADAKVAEKAIPKCNIVFYPDAEESRTVLEAFNNSMYVLNPKSIGGALPGDDFYR